MHHQIYMQGALFITSMNLQKDKNYELIYHDVLNNKL